MTPGSACSAPSEPQRLAPLSAPAAVWCSAPSDPQLDLWFAPAVRAAHRVATDCPWCFAPSDPQLGPSFAPAVRVARCLGNSPQADATRNRRSCANRKVDVVDPRYVVAREYGLPDPSALL
jgi:hypothetical protein